MVITQYSTRRVPEALESHLDKDVFVEQLDVTDAYNLFDVMRRREIDSIINLMAPPARATTPAADYRLYTVGLQNVMEAARTFGVKRVSLGNSGSVYAGLPHGPFREDDPLPVDSRTMVEAFKKGMETHAFYYVSTPQSGRDLSAHRQYLRPAVLQHVQPSQSHVPRRPQGRGAGLQ